MSLANIHSVYIYEPVKSYGFLLIKCLNMSVIYCAHILHNMHGYNHCVMEAEVLSSSIISEVTTFIITSLLKCKICYIMKGLYYEGAIL